MQVIRPQKNKTDSHRDEGELKSNRTNRKRARMYLQEGKGIIRPDGFFSEKNAAKTMRRRLRWRRSREEEGEKGPGEQEGGNSLLFRERKGERAA